MDVTVVLNITGRSLSRTIPDNGAFALFDFGTSTGNFLSINVGRTNGGNSPAWQTYLSQNPVCLPSL
jgi:hypothetical protein